MLTHLSSLNLKNQIEQTENVSESEQIRIGVLALQGAFSEHCHALYRVGVKPVEIRNADGLKNLHGLCLPGGESTVMAKLLVQNNMLDKTAKLIRDGMPVLATCAGLILLSREIVGYEDQPRLNCLDISVCRNAFGRQKESFCEEMEIVRPDGSGNDTCLFPAVFIRAPQVVRTGKNVKILARKGERILAVQEGSIVALAFHPELTENTLFHAWLAGRAREYKRGLQQ